MVLEHGARQEDLKRRLRTGHSRVRIQAEARDFSVLQIVHTGSALQSRHLFSGYLGIKRPGRDSDHSIQC